MEISQPPARPQLGAEAAARGATHFGVGFRPIVAWVCSCAVVIGATAQAPVRARTDQDVGQQIRQRLEHFDRQRPLSVAGEVIHALQVLPTFYEGRLYLPAWSQGSRPTEARIQLVSALRGVGREGLVPAHYHLRTVEELLTRTAVDPDPAALADLDLLLTDAFLIVGAHLVSGRVDPETFDPEWIAIRREVDLESALRAALQDQAPAATLSSLLPNHRGYHQLRAALALFRDLAEGGGWASIAPGPTLRPGDSGPRVRDLRLRLAATDGAERSSEVNDEVYDESLQAAVLRFQARHGLDADGVVGERTLSALNVPIEQRVRQIELNLERWRWLPQDLGRRYLLVNIPDFTLVAVEDGEILLRMRVAVGRNYRRTPIFSDTIRYLVLNPYWDVPHRLAVEDKLPEVQKDAGYLSRNGFRVYKGWGSEQDEIDTATVEWGLLSPRNFPYRLRQDPGPLNALGRIKFMFPNRFNVYLHDTPGHHVFDKAERDVSSGCIRLQRPLELAELLLRPSSRWNSESLTAALATGRETVVALDEPWRVHLLYWTAWADEKGNVHFRRDAYGRDALLAEALERAAERANTRSAGS